MGERPVALVDVLLESYRLWLKGGLERALRACGFGLIAGIDEAGRGCLAGPVVAAAVVIDESCVFPGVDDSKQLPAPERERIAALVRQRALAVAVSAIPAPVIDRVNILEATRLAMSRALSSLAVRPDCAIVDAVALHGFGFPVLPVHRADSLSLAVGCASVIAKTERDRLMNELDLADPRYGFARHKGYAAPEHLQALSEHGPSPLHRLTFASVVPRRGEAGAKP